MNSRKQKAESKRRQAALRRLLTAYCLLLSTCFLPPSRAQNLAPRYKAPAETRASVTSDAVKRGEELRRKWDLDRAEAAFREAVAIDPANIQAGLGLARIARAKFDYAGAIRLIEG